MPITLSPVEELRRKVRVLRGEEMPEPSLVRQPQTGRTYLAPTSLYEYFTGRRRSETTDEARSRQQKTAQMLQSQSQGQASGDGFSEETVISDMIRRPERNDGLSAGGMIRRPERNDGLSAGGMIRLTERDDDDASNQTAMLLSRRLQDAVDGQSDDYQTTAERNIDSIFGPRKRLSQRNIQAQAGRIPGYMPELTDEEQQRISRRLMGAARGGVVDETSPLNQRGAAFALAAARDRSKEQQKQAEQEAMSKRFQAGLATRAPDAKVESSQVLSDRRNVRTIAEKIAGVEDDPTTPMDESIRYRAEWQNPEHVSAAKEKRRGEVKANRERRANQTEQNRGAVMSGRLAAMAGASPEATGNAAIDRIMQQSYLRTLQQGGAPRSEMDDFRAAMRQAMEFDAANQGKTNLAAMTMGAMGDYKTQELVGQQRQVTQDANREQDVERDRKMNTALALLDPAASPQDQEMGRRMIREMFQNEAVNQEPLTLEDAVKTDERNQAINQARSSANNPENAASALIAALDSNMLSSADALKEAAVIGPETLALVTRHVDELQQRLARREQQSQTSRNWQNAGMPVTPVRAHGMQGRMF